MDSYFFLKCYKEMDFYLFKIILIIMNIFIFEILI